MLHRAPGTGHRAPDSGLGTWRQHFLAMPSDFWHRFGTAGCEVVVTYGRAVSIRERWLRFCGGLIIANYGLMSIDDFAW